MNLGSVTVDALDHLSGGLRTSSVVFTSAKARPIVFSSPSWVSRETSATASLTRIVR